MESLGVLGAPDLTARARRAPVPTAFFQRTQPRSQAHGRTSRSDRSGAAEADPTVPAFTSATTPARIAAGKAAHAAITAVNSGSVGAAAAPLSGDSPPSAPLFTPLAVVTSVFPQETGVVRTPSGSLPTIVAASHSLALGGETPAKQGSSAPSGEPVRTPAVRWRAAFRAVQGRVVVLRRACRDDVALLL